VKRGDYQSEEESLVGGLSKGKQFLEEWNRRGRVAGENFYEWNRTPKRI